MNEKKVTYNHEVVDDNVFLSLSCAFRCCNGSDVTATVTDWCCCW
jgi:hypothetical protein